MGVGFSAGANLHDNAQKLDIGSILSNAAATAPGRAANLMVPGATHIASGLQDFFHGLATGHALGQAAAPQTTSKAQAKGSANGGAFVDLPGVGRVQMPSAAWLAAHPAEDVKAPAAATTASAKTTNPFDEVVARFAAANGGVSLNELGALSRSAAETSTLRTQPKDPSAKDVAGMELKDIADKMYAMRTQQVAAEKDPAKKQVLMDSAVKERADYLKSILGANPVDLQTANAMGQE